MSMTVSIRLEGKTMSTAKIARGHNERAPSRITIAVDTSKSHLNTAPIPWKKEAELRDLSLVNRSKREHKRIARSNVCIGTEGIITFGTEAQSVIKSLPVEEQDRLYTKAASAIAERLGVELLSVSVHRDESAPHAHFLLPSYNTDGMPISKVLTPGARGVAAEVQDIAGAVYSEVGIQRGKKKVERIADGEDARSIYHSSLRELRERLPADIAARKAELDALEDEKKKAMERLAKDTEYLANARAKLDKVQADESAKSEVLARLTARVSTYESRLNTQSEKLQELQDSEALKLERLRSLEAEYEQYESNKQAEMKAAVHVIKSSVQEPKSREVDVITSRGFFRTKSKSIEVVPISDFDKYKNKIDAALSKNAAAATKAVFFAEHKAKTLGVTAERLERLGELEHDLTAARQHIAETEAHTRRVLYKTTEICLKHGESILDDALESPARALFTLLERDLEQRYGTVIAPTEFGCIAPPQAGVSPAQIASALYSYARDLVREHGTSREFILKTHNSGIAAAFTSMMREDRYTAIDVDIEIKGGVDDTQVQLQSVLESGHNPSNTIDTVRDVKRDRGMER